MADIQKNEQQQNTAFESNYIDENIKADQSSKAKAFVKKFLKRKTAVLGLIIIVLLIIIADCYPHKSSPSQNILIKYTSRRLCCFNGLSSAFSYTQAYGL